jgi:hypothetical protein
LTPEPCAATARVLAAEELGADADVARQTLAVLELLRVLEPSTH